VGRRGAATLDARPARGRTQRAGRGAHAPARKKGRRALWLVSLVLLLLLLPPVFVLSIWPKIQALTAGNALPWEHSTQQTPPNAAFAAFATQQGTVDPAFQAYYAAHAGQSELGTPLTPGFPTSAGVVQFFTDGALLAPGTPAGGTTPSATPTAGHAASGPGDTAVQIIGAAGPFGAPASSGGGTSATPAATGTATSTPATGTATSTPPASPITRLPVLAALLKVGSQIPVVDAGQLTYVDLRRAAMPDQMVPGAAATPVSTSSAQPVFVPVTKSNGRTVGHNVAPAFWAYMNSADATPGGWQSDIGLPVTEAQQLTITQDGTAHHLVVQAFWQAVLMVDNDATGANGQPSVDRLSIGLDYLHTLGPPTVAAANSQSAWVTADSAVLDAPATGKATVHLGLNFPVTLTGETTWQTATLWYAAAWTAAKSSGKGWLAGAAVTLTAPDKSQPAHAGFDALSPDLAAYLASQGSSMGAVVYDVTRNQYYAYNEGTRFTLASSDKVYIMCSYLDWLEGQGRGPNDDELSLLTTMIENSDNNAAQALFNRLGGAAAQQRFFQKIGITGYVPYAPVPSYWGYAQLTPSAMAHMLTLLQQGKILNDNDRKLAFNLMNNIESDQRMGVGITAPQGATYYMKDGWVDPPDGGWALNSSGIVIVGQETYIITVYSEQHPSYEWSAVEHVCGAVAKLLP
jgi:hypothetical protein